MTIKNVAAWKSKMPDLKLFTTKMKKASIFGALSLWQSKKRSNSTAKRRISTISGWKR
jgi:hypothetical protein